MKNVQKIAVLPIVISILIVGYILFLVNNDSTDLTKSEAISLLKDAYTEFKNYPNDNLPPQSIQTKPSSNGWYIAFVQEGSGRPILEASCFQVKDDKTIAFIGEYLPNVGEDRYDLLGENIFSLWIK